jgi:hypothetical protein
VVYGMYAVASPPLIFGGGRSGIILLHGQCLPTNPRTFLQKMGKKLSTFVGDSTYTRALATHRSPLRSNYLHKFSLNRKKFVLL